MKSYEKVWKVAESSYNQLLSVILKSFWCTSQIFWFGYLEALMCDQSETVCGHRFWNWSLTIRLRYSKEYITDGSNLSCFFSESIWTFETIWDSSDHSIENMICRTLQHFSRGFKRQNLFPVSMKEFQCQMDSSDLFTKIYIFSIHLKNSDSDGFRWPFGQEYSFWIHLKNSDSDGFRQPFSKEYKFWIHLKNSDSDGLIIFSESFKKTDFLMGLDGLFVSNAFSQFRGKNKWIWIRKWFLFQMYFEINLNQMRFIWNHIYIYKIFPSIDISCELVYKYQI